MDSSSVLGGEKREGAFRQVLTRESIQRLERTSEMRGEFEILAQDSPFLRPIEPDTGLVAAMQGKDGKDEIRALIARAAEHEDGDLSGMTGPRTYADAPSVGRYAAEAAELERMAADAHGRVARVVAARPVGSWLYEKCDAKCVFCYEELMGPCYKCLSGDGDGAMCKVAMGKCGHPVHSHCQQSWSGKHNCMTCQRAWVVKFEESVYGRGVQIH